MTVQHYTSPEFKKTWFTCPHCWAFSQQEWTQLYASSPWGVSLALCGHCEKISIWFWQAWYNDRWTQFNWSMVYPKASHTLLPNEDLSEDIKADYLEASTIIDDSPRWACALLRLALQKLMVQLWESGKDINCDIWNLVKAWLNPTIQKALDTVRVIWNESVHPGEIDMKDNKEIAIKLFGLINLIANALITQPKEVEELYYWVIPESKLEGIENRDN